MGRNGKLYLVDRVVVACLQNGVFGKDAYQRPIISSRRQANQELRFFRKPQAGMNLKEGREGIYLICPWSFLPLKAVYLTCSARSLLHSEQHSQTL